ncbi:hypothetical protein FDP41_009673 [Naegleria fowleri]|uniref:Uncharacterized protein n=1 Tax=Naegleria fowleri TaxID=5763 RepID=A0A6A5B061_NAEFO|nr:uncharacterized protein FDP41_009673 [Naegleria fowleri]KAF0971977.1 hypothetical protein FDP41_009673 [Naegleria fowleri]
MKPQQYQAPPPPNIPHNTTLYYGNQSALSVPSSQHVATIVIEPKSSSLVQRTSPNSSSSFLSSSLSSPAQLARTSTPTLPDSSRNNTTSAFNVFRPIHPTPPQLQQKGLMRAELIEETMEDLLREGYSRFKSIEEFNINMLLTNLSSTSMDVQQQPLSTFTNMAETLNKPSPASSSSGVPWLHPTQPMVSTPIQNASPDTNSFTQLLLGNNIPNSCTLLNKPPSRTQLVQPTAPPSNSVAKDAESTTKPVTSSSHPPQKTKPKAAKTKEKKKRPTKSAKENPESQEQTAPPKEKKRKSSQFSSSLINFQATKAKKDVQFHNYNPPNINTE